MNEIPRFGHLTPAMRAALPGYLHGTRVFDLGCGVYAGWVPELFNAGASYVCALDKDLGIPSIEWIGVSADRVEFRRDRFEEIPPHYARKFDTAWLSWPSNWHTGVQAVLPHIPQVVYLGDNIESACGDARLWVHLLQRPLLFQEQDRKNSLLIYGAFDHRLQRRDLAEEERAAVLSCMPDRAHLYGFSA